MCVIIFESLSFTHITQKFLSWRGIFFKNEKLLYFSFKTFGESRLLNKPTIYGCGSTR